MENLTTTDFELTLKGHTICSGTNLLGMSTKTEPFRMTLKVIMFRSIYEVLSTLLLSFAVLHTPLPWSVWYYTAVDSTDNFTEKLCSIMDISAVFFGGFFCIKTPPFSCMTEHLFAKL